jgi:hypothetical protein
MNVLNFILGAFALSFMSAYIYSIFKIRRLASAFARLFIAQQTLEEFLSNRPASKEVTKSEDDIHKENFIKFLSDSRDWAFEYIEEVQKGLNKFIKEVEPELSYYNKYGIVIDGMVPPHDKTLKKISREFQELKKLLPEDSDDRR